MLGKPRYKWKSGKMELQFSFYYEGIIKMGAIPLHQISQNNNNDLQLQNFLIGRAVNKGW